MRTSTPETPAGVWFVIDATGLRIGTLASKVAHVLRGKHRPEFSPHKPGNDHVVIINIEQLDLPPKKGTRKIYYDHTGYPGHLKSVSLEKMMQATPEKVMERAIKGMLPHNRLRPILLKHLHLFAKDEHPYAPQKPVPLSLSSL